MGKYPRSKLNDWFSDWHYQYSKLYSSCIMCDIDFSLTDKDIESRLWALLNNEEKPIAIIDIKEGWFTLTKSQIKLYNWFNSLDIPIFLIYPEIKSNIEIPKKSKVNFHIIEYDKNNKRKIGIFNERRYWEWEMKLRKEQRNLI